MAATESSNGEWVNMIRALRVKARDLIIDAQRASLHAQANAVSDVIVASLGTEMFGSTGMPLDAAIDLIATFSDLEAWLALPTADGRPSRLLTLFSQA